METISKGLIEGYKFLLATLPSWAQGFVNLFLIVLLIFAYSVFIWKFYKFIATKNILGLNLNKYNKSQHPFVTKLFAGGLYFIEYIIILPFIIFFWYTIFSIFLILLTENLPVSAILIISAAIISSVRMASYYKEDLAKDLAKLIPFTLLAVSIVNWGVFNFERILESLQQIPAFFNNIVTYLIFIILLEIILRSFDFMFSLFGIEEETVGEEESVESAEEETNEEIGE